jgi:aspartate aminotransferase
MLGINESETIAMTRRSQELQALGHDIINLSMGEPDFPTPDHIKAAGCDAIQNNITHYPPIAGYPALKKAISQKLDRENGLTYDPNDIMVCNGAKHAIANILIALVEKGDEVIVPAPYWVSYKELVKLTEGTSVVIRAGIEQAFKITATQLNEAITKNTRVIILNSPSNPTGSVYNRAELEALAEVIKKHPHIIVISDEIYEHIIYEGEHHSIASIDGMKNQTVVVNGVSKGFAMTGWRVGYMAGPSWLIKACNILQGQVTSGICSIAQMATLAALEGPLDCVHEMKKAFHERRDVVFKSLQKIEGLKVIQPDGAFYLFPDISNLLGKNYRGRTIETSSDLCFYLLEEAHVATVPGDAFGCPSCIRLSFAASTNELNEAMQRIHEALTN